jgi:predicted DNA-binding transcriptional regulator YafY
MRADRLIALVLLLQARGRMTAAELAERLEVAERTIYRDLDALSAAGVPVYAERGTGGGIELPDGYRLDLTALNRQEASALFLSTLPGPLADLGAGAVLDAAMQKLSAALPLDARQEAERVRQRLHLDPADWWRAPEPVPHLRTIQEAVWHDRRLRLTYQRPGRPPSERVVEPYGLVAKASIWYLVAADPRAAGEAAARPADDAPAAPPVGEVRVFRVSRILDAVLQDGTCRRPADFDLAAFWAAWCADFERNRPAYEVVLRVQPAHVPALPAIFGEGIARQIAERGRAESEGVLVVPLTFESEEAACGQILGLGPLAEVLSPPELRERVARQAAAVAALYVSASAGSDRASPRPWRGMKAPLPRARGRGRG